MKQVWEAISGEIFNTQKECADFERSLFAERKNSIKMFQKALSLMDEACGLSGCDYCPIHSLCERCEDTGNKWIDFIDENALSVINEEVD